MMEDVNLHGGSTEHSVGRSSRCNRRNVLVVGIVVTILLVILIPIVVLVPGGSSNGSSSGGPNGDALRLELINTYDRSDFHVLDKSQLDAKGSAPNEAFHWLRKYPKLSDLTHAEKLQKFALATFFYATNGIKTPYSPDGPEWKETTDWLSYSTSECEWFGVDCNDEQEVTELTMEDNGLTGSLPPEMVWLESLEYLDLTTNRLHLEGEDALDVLGIFPNLETLQMDDNYIVTDGGLPESIGKLVNLKKLVLSYNLMSGPLNNGVLDTLGKLTHLEIESNFLTGPFPQVVGEWEKLIYLYARRNALTMNLNWLKSGKMKSLFSLWLDSNNIEGGIPTEIGKLTELASLSLSDAGLGGTLPSEIGLLTGLRRFWIFTNGIGGTIPKELGNLKLLENFETHDNALTGSMPDEVCTLVQGAAFDQKSLTADCQEVTCPVETCCTECYP